MNTIMKKGLMIMLLTLSALVVCAQTKPKKTKSIEGEKVMVQELATSGVEYADDLDEDGQNIIKVPYYWFAGIASSEDRQLAIELAQREVYNTISRTIATAVKDEMKEDKIGVGTAVRKALQGKWSQVSESVIKGCRPYGNVRVEYNKKTKVYEAYAKMAIRGDQYKRMLGGYETREEAKAQNPELDSAGLDEFINANKKIFDALFDDEDEGEEE